jgi:putative ABC transport system permease protein
VTAAAGSAAPPVGQASPVLGGAGTPGAFLAPRTRRVRFRDVLRIAGSGLRSRMLRSTLTALGIAIGVAAMMGVLAISESSRAALLAQLDSLGTNLLTVTAGETFLGRDTTLPEEATAMIGRIRPVDGTAAVAQLSATVRRTDFIDSEQTGGIAVQAAELSLLDTLQGSMRAGRWLDAATERYPAVVLGSVAAGRLGIDDVSGPVMVWIGDHWFSVVGILESLPLAPEIDRSVLIGTTVARDLTGWDGSPSTIYVRTDPDNVTEVRDVLPATTNPENTEAVEVSRPSDALEAKAAAATTFTSLFLGLGAVALLVGGLGIANMMLMAVLERRAEIGLRRALGATRRQIAGQFLAEALLLSAIGGIMGVTIGCLIGVAYAQSQGWLVALPLVGIVGGIAAALAIGAVAGLYPAMRAASVSPTEALRAG